MQSGVRRLRWVRVLRDIKKLVLEVPGCFGKIFFPINARDRQTLLGLEGPSGRRYMRTCCALRLDHPLRRLCMSLVEMVWLERSVLVAIIVNCVFLAAQGPPEHFGILAQPEAEKARRCLVGSQAVRGSLRASSHIRFVPPAHRSSSSSLSFSPWSSSFAWGRSGSRAVHIRT